MAAELIGRCRCPLCRSDKARLSLAKSQLTVLTCNGCNLQMFARSSSSDELMRALLLPAEPAPAPAPEPAPSAKPATLPAPAPAPAAAAAAPSWGFFGVSA